MIFTLLNAHAQTHTKEYFMNYIGIDIGGMTIKGGLVDEKGNILFKQTIETEPQKHGDEIVGDIVTLIKSILSANGLKASDVDGIGIGSPGSIYDQKGIIRYSCNINFRNTHIVKIVQDSLGIKNVKVSNDANCAALGETVFGAGNGAQNSVMITLGTGVGTGIIVDGRLLAGNKSASAEGGHITIKMGGVKCGCGKKGCYEAYASATALINQTTEACNKYPDSILAKVAKRDGINGRTVFTAEDEGCLIGKKVLKKYLNYVAQGMLAFANIFFPEVIIVGGGISNEGDRIIKPLQRYISRNIYGGSYSPKSKVVAATLKNDAGIIGAAALAMNI